jgi:SpoVK/Ycf46/Vps4 family AAA+-type ATPase
VKRVYIPLPDPATRTALVRRLLNAQKHGIKEADMARLVAMADGYSCR